MPLRVGFLTTHPIQYQVPVFRELARRDDVDLSVFYCHMPTDHQQGTEFGIDFRWDVPLLDGYHYEVLRNVARSPSLIEFRGCDTPDIFTRIKFHQLDALVINGWVVKSCLQGLRAGELAGIPCLVRGESNTVRPRPWWKRMGHRWLLRRYAACLPIGVANTRFYVENGVPFERLFPSRYCVENDRFARMAAMNDGRTRLRESLGIGANCTCFVFSGKFIDKKHPIELVGAFGSAVDRGMKAHLLMVGDGQLKAACENLVAEHQWPVSFTGFLNQSEIVEAYVASDCLVLPSDHGETWGLVVNEAMACGRPAIVSDQAGCAEDLIAEGETGSVFRFGDWAALSECLERFSRSPDRLRAMGENARRLISDYSPAAAAQGICEAVRFCTRNVHSKAGSPLE